MIAHFVFVGDLFNEAAEGAMTAMKGRLANKYYALAEEAYAQVEEEWSYQCLICVPHSSLLDTGTIVV